MAIRFIDGFDHYATGDISGKWSFIGRSAAWSLTTGRFGGNAIAAANSDPGQYIYRDLGGNYPTGVIGFAFKAQAPNPAFNFLSLAAGGTPQVSVTITPDGTLVFAGLTSVSPPPFALTPNLWYYVEVKFSVATSIAANSCQIYIGGALYLTATAAQNTNPSAGPTMNRIIINVGTNFVGQNYYDDLYFLDIDGDTTGPLGECRIEALYPTGAGAHTAWTNTGGASNWQSAGNATPDGDTTYVSTATVNNVDSYVTSDLTSTPNTIHGVQVNLWSRKDNASPRSVEAALVIAGTTYTGGDKSLLSSYSDQTTVFRKSPATSAAWTATEVNGMEVGVKLSV
jgi:hypothetical protein